MSRVQQKQRKRRTEIIETTIRLMSDTPFEQLSVSDICEAANLSIGSFYHYFSKKSDLLVGLLSLVDSALEEEVYPSLTSENELENLHALALGFAAHVRQNGLDRSRLISGIEPFDTALDGQPRSLRLKLISLVRSGQEHGRITSLHPPEELADLLLIALRGVSVDWTRHGGRYDIVAAMDRFIALFLHALRA